jgi:hypothetical protein
MPDYRIRPGGFKEIKKRMIGRLLVMIFIVAPLGISIALFNTDKEKQQYNYISIPIIIVLLIIVFFYTIRRSVKKQKKLMDSYTLVLSENMITRYQLNTPTISLYHNELKEISKTSKGIFVIKGRHTEDVIFVPAQIENHADLEERLNNILPIATYKPKTIFEEYSIPTSLLTVGLMFGVYTAKDKFLALACCIPLAAFLAWSFYKIRVNKNIDNRVRRISWWMLLVMFSIIYATILKFSGHYK